MSMNALRILSVGLGLLSLGSGVWCLKQQEAARRFLRKLPRNQAIGRVVFAADVIWAMALLSQMDLGSLNAWKPLAYWGSPFLYFYVVLRLNEYLGAQAVALFLVLAAKPVLSVCFPRDEPARLVIVALAYAWAVAGSVFFCAPHWLRDLVSACENRPAYWKKIAQIKLAGGAILLALAFLAF